ncbi:hypothetical protein BI343_18040 [Chromobacterium amazonense]|nr:hypothetical protein BI343_18040 [Chromobacterium amazonense]
MFEDNILPCTWFILHFTCQAPSITWGVQDDRKTHICIFFYFLNYCFSRASLLMKNYCVKAKSFNKSSNISFCMIIPAMYYEDLVLLLY